MTTRVAEIPTAKVKVVPKIWRYLSNSDKRLNLVYGSAGSGKSFGVTQHLLYNHFYHDDNVRILIVRKTLPSLRTSCMRLILDQMAELNMPFEFNKSSLILQNGSNQMLFRSLDDVEKLKSIEGVTHIWIEEATEINRNDFIQLNIRMRGVAPGIKNQMYLTFNPVDANSWLKPMTEDPIEDMAVCHSTFRDNPYLDELYVAELEKLIDIDPTYYAIYNLGQWATPTNIVYTNTHWDVVPDSAWPDLYDDERYGVDFGFSSSECAGVHIRCIGLDLYIRELVYEKKVTVNDLKGILREQIDPNNYTRMICDSARPDDIEELCRAGFNAHGCKKGPGSVRTGIQRVKQYKVHVLESATHIQQEKRTYKWKEDKDGNVLDAVVAWNDHAMDAERYAVSDMAQTIADIGAFGSGSGVRERMKDKIAGDATMARANIEKLKTAGPKEAALICQAFLKHPTPEIIELLREYRDANIPKVSSRCDDVLDILQATGKMQ